MPNIDMSKSMFWQVGDLGPHYWRWVHSPVTTRFRMFQSDFMEAFSKTQWWVVPLVWIPVVFAFAAASLQPSVAADGMISSVVAGSANATASASASTPLASSNVSQPQMLQLQQSQQQQQQQQQHPLMASDTAAATRVMQLLQTVLPPAAQDSPALTYVQLAVYFMLGMAFWTLLEYCLHRFLFHMKVDGRSRALVTFHFLLHGQHHKFPFDEGRLGEFV